VREEIRTQLPATDTEILAARDIADAISVDAAVFARR
jgi:hypothetical protein